MSLCSLFPAIVFFFIVFKFHMICLLRKWYIHGYLYSIYLGQKLKKISQKKFIEMSVQCRENKANWWSLQWS